MTTTTTESARLLAENVEGIWGEVTSQDGLREVVFQRPLPMQLIDDYVRLAVSHADVEKQDDGQWFAEIAGFQGIWAKEPSPSELFSVLHEVVLEWVLLKIRDEDRDLPVLESMDLNSL